MARTKYTREVLAPIVKRVSSVTEVVVELGLAVNGGNFRYIATRIRNAELDTSHFKHGAYGRRIASLERAELAGLVAQARSVAELLALLGLPEEGRAHRVISARLRADGLDTGHFTGRGWSRGLTSKTDARVERVTKRNTYPDDVVFSANGPALNGPALVRRLVAMGWAYECSVCRTVEWCGRRLVLQLDHINGVSNDNRLENLRIVCPNCHSQTPTFSNRRR